MFHADNTMLRLVSTRGHPHGPSLANGLDDTTWKARNKSVNGVRLEHPKLSERTFCEKDGNSKKTTLKSIEQTVTVELQRDF